MTIRSIVLVGLGALLLVLAIVAGGRARQRLASYEAAPGSVVRLLAGGSHPEIRFTTGRGAEVTYPQGGLIWGYASGQPVRVLYDPADPKQTATVDAPGATLGLPLILGGLGLILLVAGAIPLALRAMARGG